MKLIPEELAVENDEHTIRVEWYDAGEGWNGDYDEYDPEDEPLLRFDVYIWAESLGEWIDPGDASYCTRMPAEMPNDILMRGLVVILEAFQDSWAGYPANWDPTTSGGWYGRNGGDYLRRLEEVSWIGPDDFKETE